MKSPIWHPCSQMKDYELFKPLTIKQARGSYIELNDGTEIIDAISSWWCKSLGHNHPRLKAALLAQLEKFEHVILANTTHETIIKLSKKLTALTKTLKKVFYASEGSSAVEIAMKMSLHARKILGERKRQNFIALANSYHGETIGALSVSDLGLYRDPYKSLLFDVKFLAPFPMYQEKQISYGLTARNIGMLW
jgi:adenosylmethionine-8-amino-7-oxononanoate aminotransferase